MTANETDACSSAASRCSDGMEADGPRSRVRSEALLPPKPKCKPWVWQTSLDNGGSCFVQIDLVDGQCESVEEAEWLIDWFELVLRRLRRQVARAERSEEANCNKTQQPKDG